MICVPASLPGSYSKAPHNGGYARPLIGGAATLCDQVWRSVLAARVPAMRAAGAVRTS